jgi:hypothetical protein
MNIWICCSKNITIVIIYKRKFARLCKYWIKKGVGWPNTWRRSVNLMCFYSTIIFWWLRMRLVTLSIPKRTFSFKLKNLISKIIRLTVWKFSMWISCSVWTIFIRRKTQLRTIMFSRLRRTNCLRILHNCSKNQLLQARWIRIINFFMIDVTQFVLKNLSISTSFLKCRGLLFPNWKFN